MISRRQVIGSGIAVSALSLAHRMAGAAEFPAADPPTPFTTPAASVAFVVVDERFAIARTLADALAAPGARWLSMPRDVLELWHGSLAPAWRDGTQAFAGVTSERGFFLLQTLAADHRLRVLSRTAHVAPRGMADETLVSFIIGPA